ncbi:GHKL domain-containing protein [Dolosigranulum savutiense]
MIKEDILFHFECKQQMSKFNMNDFDAVRLIGILLDNAIEATLEVEKKQVNIVVNQVDETLEITIENTYEVDQLSHVEMLYQPEYTTKSGHDGLGLTIVDQMSNSHHNLFVQYHPTDYFFTVVVIIT